MANKIKLCKYCKEEIKKNAKNCPHCGKYQGMSNSMGCGIILIIIIFVMAIRVGSSSPDESESSNSNSPYISYSEFVQIENGMTYNDVCEIIGSKGELISEVEVSGMSSVVMSWGGDALGTANATVYFENGVVSGKAQIGLS